MGQLGASPRDEDEVATGHIDRVRERFTQRVLPTVGKWFTQFPDTNNGQAR
jgi:hypothetical protein